MPGPGWPRQRVLVDEGSFGPRDVGQRLSEADGRLESGSDSQVGPEVIGPRGPEPFELEVGPVDHVARPEESGHRRQAVGVETPLLKLGIHCHQEGSRGRRSLGNQLPCDVGTVHEAREHGVTRVAPAVCGEVGPRYLQDPRRVPPGVQVGCRLVPVAGNVLRPLDQSAEHLSLPERREVGHDQEAESDGQGLFPTGTPPSQGRHPGTQQHGRPQDREGERTRGAANGQPGVGQRPLPEEPAKGGGPVVGMGANAHEEADHHEHQSVATVAEADQHRREEGKEG